MLVPLTEDHDIEEKGSKPAHLVVADQLLHILSVLGEGLDIRVVLEDVPVQLSSRLLYLAANQTRVLVRLSSSLW